MPHIDVTVPVPEERLADFYSLFGSWLSGDDKQLLGARSKPLRGETVSRRSRYAPLYTYLMDEVAADVDQVDMEFESIERVINAELPRSAYQHRAWWANTPSHAQANAWVSAGWRVDRVDFDNDTVTLTRNRR